MPFLTLDDIQDALLCPLSQSDIVRFTADLAASKSALEDMYLRRKLEETTIMGERHVAVNEYSPLEFNYAPGTVLGWRCEGENVGSYYNTIYDKEYYHDLMIYRGTVYWVDYIDRGVTAAELALINNLLLKAKIGESMKPEVVRYGVVSNYSVEGTSITYGSGYGGSSSSDAQTKAVSDIVGFDVSILGKLRRRVR